MTTLHRTGLTLIEVIVAMLVFAIGGLGLAAGSASVARQISANTLRARAAATARTRAEFVHALPCGVVAGGEASVAGVRSEWQIARPGPLTLDQRVERTDAYGRHSDRFLSAAPCE